MFLRRGDTVENPEVGARCDVTHTYCLRPFECRSCPLLQRALPSDCDYYWICPTCISARGPLEEFLGEKLNLVGVYNSGLCENPFCPRPDVETSFLQLAAAVRQ